MRNQSATLLLAGGVHDFPKAGLSVSGWDTSFSLTAQTGASQELLARKRGPSQRSGAHGKRQEEKMPAPKEPRLSY